MNLPGEVPAEKQTLVSPHALLFKDQIYISSAQCTTLSVFNPHVNVFKDLELATPLAPSIKALVTDDTSIFIISSEEARQIDSSGETIFSHPGYDPAGSFRGPSFPIG